MKDTADDEGYKYDEDEGNDLTDSGYWKRKLRLGERKSDKDLQEKMKRKEEKKQKVSTEIHPISRDYPPLSLPQYSFSVELWPTTPVIHYFVL